MIGAEGVIGSVKDLIETHMPAKLARFRDLYTATTAQLPDLTAVLPYEPDTLNNTRYPLAFVMDVDTPVTTYTEHLEGATLLGRVYSVNVTLFCRGTSAREVATQRRRYQLALTEILLQHPLLIDLDQEQAQVSADSLRELVATVDSGDKQILGWFDTSFDVAVSEVLPDDDTGLEPPTIAEVESVVDIGVDEDGTTSPAIWP